MCRVFDLRGARTPFAASVLLLGIMWTRVDAQTLSAFERGWQSGTQTIVTGVVTAIYADDFANRRSELMHLIRDERTGRSYRLRFQAGDPRTLRSGTVVTLSGHASGPELFVLAAQTDPNATGTSTGSPTIPQVTPVTGDQKTLVIVTNFADAAVSCSAETINQTMFTDVTGVTVDALYREASHGQVSFSGQVVGPYTIQAHSTDACDLSAWADAARSAASTSGIDLASYPRKVYVMPPSNCPGAGFGSVGGPTGSAWVFACDLKGIYSHELGHNLGLDHASTLTAEYGDTTDPMAAGSTRLRGVNAAHRQQLGWTSATAMTVVSESGYYDLAPLASDPALAPAVRTLMIPKPDTGEYYYLSYRTAQGFDNYIDSTFWNKLSVHRYKGDGSVSRTYRLAGLATGESFVDSLNGITVTLVGHDATHATARIDVLPTCVAASPTVTVSPSTLSGAAGSTQSYAVSLTNNDSYACTGSTFALTASLPSGWMGSVAPSPVTAASGATVAATLTVTSSANASAGTYTVTAAANDSAIAGHASSGSGSYGVLAQCIPSAPTLAASPASQSGFAGATLTYAIDVTNRDSPGCSSSTFSVQASLPSGWSGAPSMTSVTLIPGQTSTVLVSVTSASGTAPGSFSVSASVVDIHESGRHAAVEVTYNVQTTDAMAPSSPSALTVKLSSKAKQIQLTWAASIDNIGVATYAVRRNGVSVGTSTTTNWVDTAWLAGATYTYSVVAYDAAGNSSSASNSVTVTLSGGAGGNKR